MTTWLDYTFLSFEATAFVPKVLIEPIKDHLIEPGRILLVKFHSESNPVICGPAPG
ncbi:MAG: hypothetical protein ACQEQ7_14995 [Thermodesulfobacteriota bacterium]